MKIEKAIPSIIVILTFLVAVYGKRMLSGFFPVPLTTDFARIAYAYSWWLLPAVLVTGLLFGFTAIASHTGLHRGMFKGLVFAVVTVLPMFLSSAFIGQISADFNWPGLVQRSFLAGFMEEFLFRGFLFGLLFRKLGWGFVPAAVTGALIFGLGHVYQGSTVLQTAGVFFVTALGAVWFAWLYIEWHNNLWVPVFMHILMNLSWDLFEVSDNALGGWYTNLFRAVTIALSIIITIRYAKKNGLRINRKNMFVNNIIK